MLLPPNLEELIPEGHLVRVVNEMLEAIDKHILEAQYKGGGTSAYDPKMLLKVMIYAYSQPVFSSRRIVKELRDGGYVDLESYFVDGTKIEANTNRYDFVWRKSTANYQQKLQEKVRGLLEEIDALEEAEERQCEEED